MDINRPIIGPVEVKELHSSGKGIAYWNDKAYYIPWAIPNEQYWLQTENRRLGFRTASIIEIKKASNFRIKPICPHYFECGGCNFMHIDYSEQLNLKKIIVQNALKKYHVDYTVAEVGNSPKQINYRNKATYQIRVRQGKLLIGFHPEWTKNEIVEIESCYLLMPIINKYFNKIKNILNEFNNNKPLEHFLSLTIRANTQHQVMILMELLKSPDVSELSVLNAIKNLLNKGDSFYYYIKSNERYALPEYYHVKDTEPYIFEEIFQVKLRISPFTFFQNNKEVTELILNEIKSVIPIDTLSFIYDLYSGNGTLSLPLVFNKSVKLLGIEGNPMAVEDAKANAYDNSFATYIVGDILDTFNQHLIKLYPTPSLVILDPPRSGTLIEIQKNIIATGAPYIVYLSCNPLSLAWNLSQLVSAYTIIYLKIFDMFPQTHHIETLVVLKKSELL